MAKLVVNLFDSFVPGNLNRAGKSGETMDWKPDEEKLIEFLADEFGKGLWFRPQDLCAKLGIAGDRIEVIMRLLLQSGLLKVSEFGVGSTAEAVKESRRILDARAAAEAERRNWYKRARNWCETNRVVAIILFVAVAYGVLKTLVELGQFVWNLFHPNVPPIP
ncbi:MAG: hypothetical protein NTY65_08980 [Planctomycetota bacterium]|nr:hypothetical protein [Planctomycetota bacterium]